MLLNEDKQYCCNSPKSNFVRIITPNTQPETDTFSPIPSQDNQISFLNNNMPEQIPNIMKKKTSKSSSNNKRIDRNGNIICKNGRQKITFIDKISKNKITDIIKVESFKEYNKMEEITSNCVVHNGCCLIQ